MSLPMLKQNLRPWNELCCFCRISFLMALAIIRELKSILLGAALFVELMEITLDCRVGQRMSQMKARDPSR